MVRLAGAIVNLVGAILMRAGANAIDLVQARFACWCWVLVVALVAILATV